MSLAGKIGKHIRDMGSVKNRNQAQTEEATKGQRTYREGQRKGAVIGGVAGAVGYGAAKEEKEKQKEKRMTEKEKEEISKKLKEKSGKKEDKKEMMGGGMVKKYAKGGMVKSNCGASMKPSGGSRNK